MDDRSFTEVDLRVMLQHATGWRAAATEGRFEIDTRHRAHPWRVVVEPDSEEEMLVVITCYPVEAA